MLSLSWPLIRNAFLQLQAPEVRTVSQSTSTTFPKPRVATLVRTRGYSVAKAVGSLARWSTLLVMERSSS